MRFGNPIQSANLCVKCVQATIAEEKKKDARPPSAYLLFCSEQRASLTAKNPGIKATEVVRQLAAAWKALAEEDKSVYQVCVCVCAPWHARSRHPENRWKIPILAMCVPASCMPRI